MPGLRLRSGAEEVEEGEGQRAITRLISPAASRLWASSSAGLVLPAPGAAEIRNGPSRQPARRCSAWCCQARRAVVGVGVVRAGGGVGVVGRALKEPGILRDGADGWVGVWTDGVAQTISDRGGREADNGCGADGVGPDTEADRRADTLGGRTATWRSGYAAACKAVYTGSIPVVALAWLGLDGICV